MSRWRMIVWPLVVIAAAFLVWRDDKNRDAGPAVNVPNASLPSPSIGGVGPTDDLNYEVRDFTLTDVDGQPFGKQDLDGKLWVASFFFSSCPGQCLQLNNQVAELAREFGPQGVTFVSFTVDPETDTPEQLKRYADRFALPKEQWRFLTGDYSKIEDIAINSFKVGVGDRTGSGPPGSYDIAHTDRLMIVDRTGKVRGAHRGRDADEVKLVKRKLTDMLKETP